MGIVITKENLLEPYCIACGKPIKNELILIPNGYGTGYLVFDSLVCLKHSATKYDLYTFDFVSNNEVDKLVAKVKKRSGWSIKYYGIEVVYELIRKERYDRVFKTT